MTENANPKHHMCKTAVKCVSAPRGRDPCALSEEHVFRKVATPSLVSAIARFEKDIVDLYSGEVDGGNVESSRGYREGEGRKPGSHTSATT